jgi:hypothetical protein
LLKFPGLYRVQPDGSIRVKLGDTYKRQVQIAIPLRLMDGDTRTLSVRSSREATIAGQYANAVKKVLARKADPAILEQFKGVTVGGHRLLTDVAALRRVADAGLIRIDQFGSGQELRGGELWIPATVPSAKRNIRCGWLRPIPFAQYAARQMSTAWYFPKATTSQGNNATHRFKPQSAPLVISKRIFLMAPMA